MVLLYESFQEKIFEIKPEVINKDNTEIVNDRLGWVGKGTFKEFRIRFKGDVIIITKDEANPTYKTKTIFLNIEYNLKVERGKIYGKKHDFERFYTDLIGFFFDKMLGE